MNVLGESGISGLFGTVCLKDLPHFELLAERLGVQQRAFATSYPIDHLATLDAQGRLPGQGVIVYLVQATTKSDLQPYAPHNVFWTERLYGVQSSFRDRFLPLMVVRADSYTRKRSDPNAFDPQDLYHQ